MNKIVVIFFTFLGVVFLALLIASIAATVGERTRRKLKEYKYKHRFNKSPTAECYCVDFMKRWLKWVYCAKKRRWIERT